MGWLQLIIIILLFLLLAFAFIKSPSRTFDYVKGLAVKTFDLVKYGVTEGIDLYKEVRNESEKVKKGS